MFAKRELINISVAGNDSYIYFGNCSLRLTEKCCISVDSSRNLEHSTNYVPNVSGVKSVQSIVTPAKDGTAN